MSDNITITKGSTLADAVTPAGFRAIGIQGGENKLLRFDQITPGAIGVSGSMAFFFDISVDETLTLPRWVGANAETIEWSAATGVGTCSVTIAKNGGAVPGFAAPVPIGIGDTTIPSVTSLAKGDKLVVTVSSANGLDGLHIGAKIKST